MEREARRRIPEIVSPAQAGRPGAEPQEDSSSYTVARAASRRGRHRDGERMMDRVVILGWRPGRTGAAARAVIDSGRDPIIISNKREPGRLYGSSATSTRPSWWPRAPRATVGCQAHPGSPEEYRQEGLHGDKATRYR